MIKFIKWLSLTLAFTILAACQTTDPSNADADDSSTNAESSSSEAVQEPEVDYEAIIDDLRAELNRVSEENWNLYLLLYGYTLNSLQDPILSNVPHVYAFYDINHDGIAELITGRYDENDELYLNSLYYLEDYQYPSEIAANYKFSIANNYFEIFTDGTILTVRDFEGQDLTTAELLEINDTNTDYDIIDEITIDREAEDRSIPLAEDKEKIDLDAILWHDYNKIVGNTDESTDTSDNES